MDLRSARPLTRAIETRNTWSPSRILRHSLTLEDPPAQPANRALLLPLPVTSFVGRHQDRLAVAGLLGEVRLLILHGP
jgi:hypothetical protein